MRIVDVGTLSEYLGVSKWTIYRWIQRKMIPHHKCGEFLLRFDMDEIDRWIKGVKIRRKRGDKRI